MVIELPRAEMSVWQVPVIEKKASGSIISIHPVCRIKMFMWHISIHGGSVLETPNGSRKQQIKELLVWAVREAWGKRR